MLKIQLTIFLSVISLVSFASSKDHKKYLIKAFHGRKLLPNSEKTFRSTFSSKLHMIRVKIPQTLNEENKIIKTSLGKVDLIKDHLAGSVQKISELFSHRLEDLPQKVELLTIPRMWGMRMGTMSIYLGFKSNKDKLPYFYVLEAGTMTGKPKQLYFAPHIGAKIKVLSGYKPSPFSSEKTTYSGSFHMKGSEPSKLVIRANSPNIKKPYMTVIATFKRDPSNKKIWPGRIIAEAAARIGIIAKAIDVKVKIEKRVAQLVKLLKIKIDWIIEPKPISK